jgi:hypothetical protein
MVPWYSRLLASGFVVCALMNGAEAKKPAPAVAWKKHAINAEAVFEGVGIADFDGDGRLDVLSGDTWYAAPRWTRHRTREVPSRINPHYAEDLGSAPLDVDGDGKMDVVTCSFFGKRFDWVQNPGNRSAPWPTHTIDQPGTSETCLVVDVNGDKRPDVVPATTDVVVWYEVSQHADGPIWKKHYLGK